MAFQVMLYQVLVYCISDTGFVRQNNEDSYKLLKEENFFVLADGMGGHQAGEIASREAVERICALFQQHLDVMKDLQVAKQMLVHLIQEVNIAIFHMGYENVGLRGMGTTLCCVFLHPEGLIYVHVGDSRIYRFRAGHLTQLTRDHSLLRELIDLGQLNEEQAEDFLYKNIITKAIGTEPFVEPSVESTSLESGDLILMCTDGLSDLVSFEEIQNVMRENPVKEVAHLLVEKAKRQGGYDNISVIVIKVQDKHGSNLSGL